MNSYILVAAAASVLKYVGAKAQPPTRRRLEGYPACCVEHSYWADGEVTGTTCHGRRSPWDASTMSDLCTAGYSEAGEWAPPFRDCSQAAIDADAGCGTADWETCQVCADYGIPIGMFFANVGYTSCPDWVVDAAREEAAEGGQCAPWFGYEDEDGDDDDDDDDDDDSVGKIVGPIVAGIVIVTVAIGPWVYCHMRKKAAKDPPPMVEPQVLGTVVSVDGLGVGEVVGGCDALASEGTVESGPLQGFPVPSAPLAEEMPAAAPLRNWEMPPPAPPRNFCSACGAPVQGPFCGQCGARA